jgi:hypothetical protein
MGKHMGSSTIGSSEVLVLLPDFLNLFHRISYLHICSFMPLQGEKNRKRKCFVKKQILENRDFWHQ